MIHLHLYKTAEGFENAVYPHQECRCGKRRVLTNRTRGYSAVDTGWIETGEKTIPSPPPKKP